jgi:hypothetical protein
VAAGKQMNSNWRISMKWIIVSLNLVAAIAFVMFGSIAASIHHVHSYSMYREFVERGVIDDQKIKTISQSDEHYDVVKRMQAIGNAESWFSEISDFAAATCLLNATAIYFLTKKTTNRN